MADAKAGGMMVGGYWAAWFFLLVLTVAMVSVTQPALIIAGITMKAGVILLGFMHLRHERIGLALTVIVTIFALTFLLFGLIAIDAAPNAH